MSQKSCGVGTWGILALFIAAPACGGPGTGDDATMGDEGGTTDVQTSEVQCAKPEFVGNVESTQLYICEGHALGTFKYDPCPLVGSCGPSVFEGIDGEGETEGDIPFPGDPTEGGVDVEVCCDQDVEETTDGEAIGEDGCKHACATNACLKAIEQFQTLLDDPATDDPCLGFGTCEGHVHDSLVYYRDFVHDHFDICVASIMNDVPLNMGAPPCKTKVGCLTAGVLDVSCNINSIDLENGIGECKRSPAGPPVATLLECEVDDAIVTVTDGVSYAYPGFDSGNANTAYFACSETMCPFIVEGMTLAVDNFMYGGYLVSNAVAQLYIAAYGESDGTTVEFAAGAIRVRVTGLANDGVASIPFDVIDQTVEPAIGTHSATSFDLDNIILEGGGYQFGASFESTCSSP